VILGVPARATDAGCPGRRHRGLFRSDASRYDCQIELSTFIWMFLVLKVPVLAALVLIWWAVREPEPVEADPEDDGGGSDRDAGAGPRPPRPPRRGPHGDPLPPSPRRVRTASGRPLRRASR